MGRNHGISGLVQAREYICERCDEPYELHSLKKRKYCHECSMAVDRERVAARVTEKGVGYARFTLEYTLEGQSTFLVPQRAKKIINQIKERHYAPEPQATATDIRSSGRRDRVRDDCTVDLTQPEWRD